jgi:hypothetical protein
MIDAPFLTTYLTTLDHTPEDVLDLLSPDISFCILWSVDGEAREFAGGMEELRGYFAQREPDGQLHHVEHAFRSGKTEVALGHTTKHGQRLGTFMMAVEVDADGRLCRLFAGRTTSVRFAAVG